MGQREVIIKESVADSVAEIAWHIESRGLVATAERFTDSVYDFFAKLADSRRRQNGARTALSAPILFLAGNCADTAVRAPFCRILESAMSSCRRVAGFGRFWP